jgi:hypothetical protein
MKWAWQSEEDYEFSDELLHHVQHVVVTRVPRVEALAVLAMLDLDRRIVTRTTTIQMS